MEYTKKETALIGCAVAYLLSEARRELRTFTEGGDEQ